jgi:hypothetical protein
MVGPLGIFFIVNGALVVMMGLLFLGAGLVGLIEHQTGMAPEGENPYIVAFVVVPAALMCFAFGAFHILVGIRTRKFLGRKLAIAGASTGIVTTVLCYCSPVGIVLFVLGLVVLLDPHVIQAFESAERGGG